MHWKRSILRLSLIPIIAILFVLSTWQIETSLVSNKREVTENMQIERQNRLNPRFSPESSADGLSCAYPDPSIKEKCELYEQQILATVVRLEVLVPTLDGLDMLKGGGGHGTIKDGRFIVVHNHFSVDLAIFADENQKDMASLNLYTANGLMVLRDARPPLFEIVIEDQETLILDFGTNDEGEGFFDWFRVPSSPFTNIHEITIQPGSEVAQVNWDGEITYIEWVRVQEVITNDEVPKLVLANPINDGSSGGGVFWDGVHIANNWMRIDVIDQEGAILYQYSIAAINSVAIAPN